MKVSPEIEGIQQKPSLTVKEARQFALKDPTVKVIFRSVEMTRGGKFMSTDQINHLMKQSEYSSWRALHMLLLTGEVYETSNGIYPEMAYQTAAYQHARQQETKQRYHSRWRSCDTTSSTHKNHFKTASSGL